MKRDFINQLFQWKNDFNRKPLLLRGARQVGKSYIVKTFGESFSSYIEINFEKDKSAKTFFRASHRGFELL